MRWSLVLIIAALPVLAQAKDPLVSAEAYLEEMEYGKALKLVGRVLASSDRGPGELVKAYRIKGLCQAAAGKTEASMLQVGRPSRPSLAMTVRPSSTLPAS